MSFDFGTVVVLMVAAALAGLLVGVLPVWRRLMSGDHRLPVWQFLRRGDVSPEGRTALLAELRCELCDERAACLERLKTGAVLAPENCPNAALLEGGRLDQSFFTKDSRSAGRMPAA